MSTLDGLRQVWRKPDFRRLLLVKLLAQTADGTVQIGVAAYTLFSPERQPNAWAIAGVLAVTMLPFSVLGPFVSVVIDRWDRRRTILVADSLRLVLCLLLAGLVLAPSSSGWELAGIMVTALVVMSLERFQIATLLAALPHTVSAEQYLAANTVLPIIGPFGMMVGAGLAAAIRLTIGRAWSITTADSLIFAVAAVGFLVAVVTTWRFRPRSLGPTTPIAHSLVETWRAMGEGLAHLRRRRPAALGVWMVALQRTLFGIVMVAVILLFRQHFHAVTEVDAAIADLSIWAVATGAGFVLSSVVNPFLAKRVGLRRVVIVVLALSGICQLAPGAIFTRPTLIAASFLLGLWAQCLKMNCDTLVQAHVEDTFKGRVLVIYDIAFNTPLVLAAVIAALVLPVDGYSHLAFGLCALGYFGLAGLFAWRSRSIGVDLFKRGTESVTDQ
ncbi:MAG: MFS transporter [Propionibacteriaceae bacterium]|jgi:MFS family permease|nr:MFS transporter [Propionibacteriaceae bacterium]